MEFFDIAGIRLAANVSGPSGAMPLLLLHSGATPKSSWDSVAPAVSKQHRVYAVDMHGYGDSDRPGHYSFELMRDDVLGLMDALGGLHGAAGRHGADLRSGPARWKLRPTVTASTLLLLGDDAKRERMRDTLELLPDGRMAEILVGYHIHREALDEFLAAVVPFLDAMGDSTA